MPRPKNIVTILLSLFVVGSLFYALNSTSTLSDPKPLSPTSGSTTTSNIDDNNDAVKIQIQGKSLETVETAFMPKMVNETLKAELGRSSWRLFHTILARYSEKPTDLEKNTLSAYIDLFAKVYPCGDCARHFQKLLAKYPPQLNSRQIASVWGCHIHNKVNERLQKPEYDCSNILEDYDCGCGTDELDADSTLEGKNLKELQDHLKFDIKKEGKQLG